MSVLAQKNILIGVSGGIAAYKIPLLIRKLIKLNSNVKVVMTPSSKEFVTPLTLSTVSKNEVFSEFTTEKNSNPTWNNHVELAEWADIFIIAPATSNTISSMAHARCDNLLLACYLSSKCPVFVAPAMDLEMYKNTLNQKNIKKLLTNDTNVLPVGTGSLASGLDGEGRMLEPDEIIEYVQKRYGFDKVAQIITFGELKSRAVIRDTGRVLEMPYSQVDRIAKLIPNNPARPLTISEAINEVDELQMVIENDEQVKSLIEVSQKIEGLFRHASTHAAGIVIGHRKISDIVPLYRDPKSEMPATQFNMKWVEKAGLVKFDFLGLQTLTMIKKTIDLLKLKNIHVNFNEIPLTDRKTFDILSEGKSLGIFQLESGGMKEVLKGLKPDRFEDIIAIVALYRPGPMENIPTYISRKHGAQEVEYMHPDLEGILKETYGIMIYQEQVQQAAQILAGYSLGAADILRRAMGKKIKSEMDAQREKFVAGANEKSISSKLSNKIFDQISAFAGYGFNKSHAAGYALITYQTAWLRAHYPYEFFAASMSLEKNNTDKLAEFVIEAKARSIKINPPNINGSFSDFLVLNDEKNVQSISYGLSSIKNVGQAAIEDLVKEREITVSYTHLTLPTS